MCVRVLHLVEEEAHRLVVTLHVEANLDPIHAHAAPNKALAEEIGAQLGVGELHRVERLAVAVRGQEREGHVGGGVAGRPLVGVGERDVVL